MLMYVSSTHNFKEDVPVVYAFQKTWKSFKRIFFDFFSAPINKVRALWTFPTPSFHSPFPSHSPFCKNEAPLPKKGPLSDKKGKKEYPFYDKSGPMAVLH